MPYTKFSLLNQAIEITKEAAKGGTDRPLETVVTEIYKKLKELNEDVKSEE